ncbi:MAG: hypothetical protein KDC33_02090 [Thermoleophilia bacterium]|nr:hypothetical protein [Thermoleophilia bacterium]
MSTSHIGDRPSAFDRAVAYVLDFDGDLYGRDERERTRWYEGIALAASAQWILVPWVAAIMIWSASAETARAIAGLGLAFILPMALATIYVEHRRVQTTVERWTAKRVLWSVITILPVAVFLAGFVRVGDLEPSTAWGIGAGALVGLALAVLGMSVRRKDRGRPDAGDDQ